MQKQISFTLFNLALEAFFFLLFLPDLSFALDYPSFNGYQIVDLTSKNSDTFSLETQKWTVSGLSGTANSSLCGSNNPLLGGPGILGANSIISKTYSSLPTHTAIYYQIKFSLIDQFKPADKFTLTLASTSIPGGTTLKTYNSYITTNTCGGSDPDTTQFTIVGSMPHTANTVTFQAIIKFTGSATLGIRDISLTFVNDSSVTTATSCFRVFDSKLLGLSGECSCVKGAYSNSGTCTGCNSACQNCFGPSASQCFACASGYSFVGSQCIKCDSSCLTCTGSSSLQCVTCKDGYWLQLNGSCTASCDLPVVSRQVVGSLQLCYPACNASQYFVWDGTCANNCSSPLVNGTAGTNKLCNKPCKTGEYLYSNGTCIVGCSGSLKSNSSNGVDFCNKPCQTGVSLYWNGSCIAGCTIPLVSSSTSDGVLVCNTPCQNSDYLYWNASCISGCSAPLKSSSSNGVSICDKPCQSGEYLYWDGSCSAGCIAPLVSSTNDSVFTCNQPCQTGEYLYWNDSCVAGCISPLVSSSTSENVLTCNQPCKAGEYLSWGNLCIGSCPSPFVSSISNNNVTHCNKPCQNNEFLYKDDSCHSSCPSPFISLNTSGVALCNEPCQNTEYLYWNGTCNSTCLAPLIPSNNTQNFFCNKPCKDFEYLYEDNSCQVTCPTPYLISSYEEVSLCKKPCRNHEFLYWDNSCNATCSAPLVSSTINNVSICKKPCQNNDYLYSDGSCLSSCLAPLVISSSNQVTTCSKPCKNNEFLDWNNYCIASCLSPLVSSTNNSVALCKKHCQSNEFLYSDGSCLSTCPSPFKSSSSLNGDLCQAPCSSSEFLFPDGSCSDKCPAPLVSSTPADGIQRCSSPCTSSSDFYYYANGTCGSTCGASGKIQMREFLPICLTSPPLSDQGGLTNDERNSVDKVKGVTEAAGKTASAGMAASSLISSKSSGAVTLISLIKMLEYIRYMDIDYPPKLQYMMSSQDESSISLNFDVDLPESAQKKFPDYSLPRNFEKYHMVSSFLVNYWEALFTLGTLLLILSAVAILAVQAKDVKYVGTYSTKIRDILKWNFFLIVLCANIDSVGVFSSLELRTTHCDTFISVIGTSVCIFINLLVIYLMLLIPYIIYSLRRTRGKISPEGCKTLQPRDSQRFALCGVLFMNFKQKSVLQHSCMLFILFRVYLFNIIIGYLFEYPLPQAILITTMSFLMLGYLIITRPFQNPLELIKTLTYEIIIATVNICVLILAIMDHNGIKNKENRVQLGDVIIFSNMAFNLMAVLFIVVELVIKLIKVFKIRKAITAKGWRYWFTITTFLIQPEELEMKGKKPHRKEQPGIRIQIKCATQLEENSPSFPNKSQTPFDDQTGHDSDLVVERDSSIPMKFSSSALRLNMNKVRISKINSIVSGWTDMSSQNILSPTTERTSLFFPQGQLSARSLLSSQDNHSAANSPRLEMPSPGHFNFQDLEQNKLVTDSLNLGMPGKLDEEKGILVQRNKSSEAYLNNKERRRTVRVSKQNSVIMDHNESETDLSFEVGAGTVSGMNTPRQSRFSRYLPEKAKNPHKEEDA